MKKPTDTGLLFNLALGMIGALLLAFGDWTMIYGDPQHTPGFFWLSEGAKHIPDWRNTLALATGIPGVILCAMGMLSLEHAVKPGMRRINWRYLTAYSLLPWLTVHAFIVMQIYLFGWMSRNGYEEAAFPTLQALNEHFSWMALVCYGLIMIPFIMWLVLGLRGRLRTPRLMGLVNPIVFVPILVLLRPLIPNGPAKPGYINGEISTSFFLFFLGIFLYFLFSQKRSKV